MRKDPAIKIEIGNLPRIEADPVQVRQLFQKLPANVLKYRGKTTCHQDLLRTVMFM